MKHLTWDDRHDTSTPNCPQNNGMMERAVTTVKEGARALIIESGLHPELWADAMRCFCFLHNVYDILANGFTAYQNRFDNDFEGPMYRFGSEIK